MLVVAFTCRFDDLLANPQPNYTPISLTMHHKYYIPLNDIICAATHRYHVPTTVTMGSRAGVHGADMAEVLCCAKL